MPVVALTWTSSPGLKGWGGIRLMVRPLTRYPRVVQGCSVRVSVHLLKDGPMEMTNSDPKRFDHDEYTTFY
jgi:hypothetical protein